MKKKEVAAKPKHETKKETVTPDLQLYYEQLQVEANALTVALSIQENVSQQLQSAVTNICNKALELKELL